ncbi:hypothetical protein DFH09DRAFT_1084877 [Mycena vulgaris]|nr:hypothetical protein DFH09DRAFT_1084877 [Mycena vulgaris]
MQPCLEAQFGKIIGSWLDLDSTESADLEQLPKEGGTGVEVTTATSELKTLFNATRGSSEEEDETKLKEDSYIRLERKERANAALIRNMVAPATETQRPWGIFFLHQSFGGPPTPLKCSCAFYILHPQTPVRSRQKLLVTSAAPVTGRRTSKSKSEIASVASVHRERANEEPRSIKACDRASLSHTNRAFHGQNLYPYNPTHSILRLCWGWILAKVFSLYFVFALLPGDFCVWYTELGDSSWGLWALPQSALQLLFGTRPHWLARMSVKGGD